MKRGPKGNSHNPQSLLNGVRLAVQPDEELAHGLARLTVQCGELLAPRKTARAARLKNVGK